MLLLNFLTPAATSTIVSVSTGTVLDLPWRACPLTNYKFACSIVCSRKWLLRVCYSYFGSLSMFSQCSKCSAFGSGPVFYLQEYTGWKDLQLHMCAAREFPCQNFHTWSCCKYQTHFDEGMPKGRMKKRKFGCTLAIRDAAVKWLLQISFDHLLLWCALNAHISVSNSAATAGNWTHNLALAEYTVYMIIHATVLNISYGALWPYQYVVPLLVNSIHRKDAKMLRRKAACSYMQC